MALNKFWSRYLSVITYNPTGGTSADLVATIQPNQTILRSVITLDHELQSSTAPFADAQQDNAWGLIPGPSSSFPPYFPVEHFGEIATRWLWIDQLQYRTDAVDLDSTTKFWRAMNTAHSQYTDCHTQYTNNTGVPQYVWLVTQVAAAIKANCSVYGSFGVSLLIGYHA